MSYSLNIFLRNLQFNFITCLNIIIIAMNVNFWKIYIQFRLSPGITRERIYVINFLSIKIHNDTVSKINQYFHWISIFCEFIKQFTDDVCLFLDSPWGQQNKNLLSFHCLRTKKKLTTFLKHFWVVHHKVIYGYFFFKPHPSFASSEIIKGRMKKKS